MTCSNSNEIIIDISFNDKHAEQFHKVFSVFYTRFCGKPDLLVLYKTVKRYLIYYSPERVWCRKNGIKVKTMLIGFDSFSSVWLLGNIPTYRFIFDNKKDALLFKLHWY